VDPAAVSTEKRPAAARGLLLLADISGYTAFLQDVALAHRDDAFADGAVPDAYAVISSLLDGIVGRVVPPFRLSKLEGDAVFAYAREEDSLPRGRAMLDCLLECHAEFRHRLGTAREIWQCWCDACARIEDLDLKFIVHAGPYVMQEIAGTQELVGPEVVLAHRLLKPAAAERARQRAFVLVTAPAAALVDIPTRTAVPIVETYDKCAPIEAFIFPVGEGE
jgi:Protein of unknown function (DUF2652)